MNPRTAIDPRRVAEGSQQHRSVAAGVPPAVEGGVSPPGIPAKFCRWPWCGHLHAWIAPFLLTALVILGSGSSLAAVPVFRALPSGIITCETLRAGFHKVQVVGKAMRVIRFRKVKNT